MILGTLELELRFRGATSLKEKRSVLQSVLRRSRNRFNASIAEVADMDHKQRSQVAVAVVGNERQHIRQQLDTILAFIEAEPRLEVVRSHFEVD